MQKQQKISHIFIGLIVITATAILLAVAFLGYRPASAAIGTNETINYQGRLLDVSGGVVPDGTYNMEFKITQDGDGCNPTSGTFPCGGTVKWTETRENSNKVLVRNGYFTVYLGAITSFGSSVDWNQDSLWLSINVGGTGAPSYDGEMKPLTRLSSTVYALNTKQLGGLSASQFIQIGQGVQADASSTNPSVFINKTGGSANLFQLQRGGADVFVINNNGTVTFKPTTDTTTAFQILPSGSSTPVFNVNTLNSRVGIGLSDPLYAFSVGSGNKFGVDSAGALHFEGATTDSFKFTITPADPTANRTYTIPNSTATTDQFCLQTLFNCAPPAPTTKFQDAYNNDVAGAPAQVLTASTTKTILFRAGVGFDTSNLFQIKDAAGVDIFTVDTEAALDAKRVMIGSPIDDATTIFLTLDTENDFTEATTCTSALGGSIYYNNATSVLRACVNGQWEDLPSTAGLSLIIFGVVAESGTSPGDIGGLVTTNQSGPCKVSYLTTNSVRVAPCTAYSSGRKVVVPQTDLTGFTGASLTFHICLNGTNNQPVSSIGGAENANLPAFNPSNPVLCLADVKTSAVGVLAQIYDTRVFTTSEKTYATINSTNAPGMIVVGTATAHVFQTAAAADAPQIRGVVVATSGTASTTTINAIIVTSGTQWVKCTGTCAVNANMTTSTTAGYGESGTANAIYPYIGNTRRAVDTLCTGATNCQMSNLVEIRISDT